MDEGLKGLQMLPSPWLAMGLPLQIPVHVLSRARVIFLFFVGFFLLLACFEHGGQKVPLGVCGFAQKPTQTVLDRGIPYVAWSMLDLALGNPEAGRPTSNQTKIASYGTRSRHAYRSGRATHPGHSALGFYHQQVLSLIHI